MSTPAIWMATVLLAGAGLLSAARALRRGSIADRTLGLDLFVVVLATAVTVRAARTGVTSFLPLVTVVALLAFVATVTIARFLEATGRNRAAGGGTGPDATEEAR